MSKGAIAGGVFVILAVLFAAAAGYRALDRNVRPAAATSPAIPPAAPTAERKDPGAQTRGSLYGRISTVDGATYEGRVRWGRGEEAFWGDYLNGFKDENRWAAFVPPEQLPRERSRIEIFGLQIAQRERRVSLGRFFMARFGDVARIEVRGRDVQVALKSGTVFHLDRFEAGDLDDGVRVWDGAQGVVDLDSLRIRTIEFLPTAALAAASDHLHGTVRTQLGDFTGFIQWDRRQGATTDELHGRTADGELDLRFDTLRSIARRSPHGALATLQDGREIVLSKTQSGDGNHGMYVDDRRYGRVLVSWDAFDRVDYSPGGAGPSYADFPPGSPLAGTVTTRDGRRLVGRLVYDLDESETTETLDAPSQGVDYTIPFGLVASIVPGGREARGPEHARVTLHSGEELQLEPSGDLGEGNAGILIFVAGAERPEYAPWTDVERLDLDRPPAMYPPLDGH
jgi:hypothetical protein